MKEKSQKLLKGGVPHNVEWLSKLVVTMENVRKTLNLTVGVVTFDKFQGRKKKPDHRDLRS